MPEKKQIVPRILSVLVKIASDRCIPIENAKPTKNKAFPIAIRAVSKNINTPSVTNIAPRQINPTPIFWLSFSTMLTAAHSNYD
jgi:hypothetical protein